MKRSPFEASVVGLAAPTVRMSYSAARREGHWSIWAEPVDLLSSPVQVTTTTCKMFAKMLTRSPRRKAYCRFDGF